MFFMESLGGSRCFIIILLAIARRFDLEPIYDNEECGYVGCSVA